MATATVWEINAAAQENDPDSILNFYRSAIRLRKSLSVVRYGIYREHFPLDGKRYVYSREMDGQKLLVVCFFSEKQVKMKVPVGFNIGKSKLILWNYKVQGSLLQPYESCVYLWE